MQNAACVLRNNCVLIATVTVLRDMMGALTAGESRPVTRRVSMLPPRRLKLNGLRFAPIASITDDNWWDDFGPNGTNLWTSIVAADDDRNIHVGGWFTMAGGINAAS